MYAPLGSISTGTLLSADIASSLANMLEALAHRDTDPNRKALAMPGLEQYRAAAQAQGEEALAKFNAEKAPSLIEMYCAPYTSLRSHDGDGADIGIFADVDSLEETARYQDGVIKANAGDQWPDLNADVDYVTAVTDPGNVSLYASRSRKEIWACV